MHPDDRASLDKVVCAIHGECERLHLDAELSIREDGRVELRFIRARDGSTRVLLRAMAFDPDFPEMTPLSKEILKLDGISAEAKGDPDAAG